MLLDRKFVISDAAFMIKGTEAACFFLIPWSAVSFVLWATETTVQTELLTRQLFRSKQFAGSFGCSSLAFKLSGFIGFCQNIFVALAMGEDTSGPYWTLSAYLSTMEIQ